jgi:hypothetical protein
MRFCHHLVSVVCRLLFVHYVQITETSIFAQLSVSCLKTGKVIIHQINTNLYSVPRIIVLKIQKHILTRNHSVDMTPKHFSLLITIYFVFSCRMAEATISRHESNYIKIAIVVLRVSPRAVRVQFDKEFRGFKVGRYPVLYTISGG